MLAFLGPQVFSLENMNPFRPAGVLFRFPILHIDRPNRGEIMRGFFENVAFAMRGNAEQVTQVSGVTPSAVHLGGGMTRSDALLRVIAETLGRSIVVSSVTETASLGSAMLAAGGVAMWRCRHYRLARTAAILAIGSFLFLSFLSAIVLPIGIWGARRAPSARSEGGIPSQPVPFRTLTGLAAVHPD